MRFMGTVSGPAGYLCIYIYVHMYVSIYIHIPYVLHYNIYKIYICFSYIPWCMCVCIYTQSHTCILYIYKSYTSSMCMYVCLSVCLPACLPACMHACMYVCMYSKCLCIYVSMYVMYQQYRTRRWRKFQKQEPIGEVGCCESRMGKRIH